MIHLNLMVQDGGAIYLDLQRIEIRRERTGEFFALTGTLGDGLYEGQVLLEIGEGVEVTFVDDWLGGPDLRRLFQRVERERVEAALIAMTSEMRFCLESFPVLEGKTARRVIGYQLEDRWYALRPQEYAEQLELPLAVAQSPIAWESRAA